MALQIRKSSITVFFLCVFCRALVSIVTNVEELSGEQTSSESVERKPVKFKTWTPQLIPSSHLWNKTLVKSPKQILHRMRKKRYSHDTLALGDIETVANWFSLEQENYENPLFTLFSKRAQIDLHNRIIERQGRNESLTVVTSGGSISAGAGGAMGNSTYSSVFQQSLLHGFQGHLDVVFRNFAHGNRWSFHTYELMHNFIPAESDILLWEFSLNDCVNLKEEFQRRGYKQFSSHADKSKNRFGQEMQRNLVRLYFQQLERLHNYRGGRPPAVILVMFWDAPFTVNKHTGYVERPFYDAIVEVASEFDSILGAVHAYSLMEPLTSSWAMNDFKTHLLIDATHPTRLFHCLVGRLLYKVIEDQVQLPSKADVSDHGSNNLQQNNDNDYLVADVENTKRDNTKVHLQCGNKTKSKRAVRKLLEEYYPI